MPAAFLFLCDVPGVNKSSRPEGEESRTQQQCLEPGPAWRGGEGRPVYHQAPCAQGEATSKPVVQELVGFVDFRVGVLGPSLTAVRSVLGTSRGSSGFILTADPTPSPMGAAVGFPKKRD